MTAEHPGQPHAAEHDRSRAQLLTTQRSVVIGFALVEALGIGWAIATVILRDAR